MPHFIVEYTDNIKEEANMPELLKKVHDILISRSDVYPIAGIRSRAVELTDYRVADGAEDDAFVHAVLKIASGRSKEVVDATCEEIFVEIKDHFAGLFEKRYLALSMELIEFDAATHKHNNIHKRFSGS